MTIVCTLVVLVTLITLFGEMSKKRKKKKKKPIFICYHKKISYKPFEILFCDQSCTIHWDVQEHSIFLYRFFLLLINYLINYSTNMCLSRLSTSKCIQLGGNLKHLSRGEIFSSIVSKFSAFVGLV
jgi:hypothetical protein